MNIRHPIKRILICLSAAIILLLFSATAVDAAQASNLPEPKLSSVVNTTTGVRISWGSVRGASMYRVFIRQNGTTWKKLADTKYSFYIHKAAVSGTKYNYTVRCISADGKRYVSSFDNVGKSIYYVKAPLITSLSNTNNGVHITWRAVKGALKYRVYLKNGTSWKAIGDTTQTAFTHTKAVSGQTCTYTVRCVSPDGKKNLSDFYSGNSIVYIKTPQISAVTDESNGAKLAWSPVKGAAKYRVYLKVNDKWKSLADVAVPYYTHSAQHMADYTYTLRCLSASGTPVSGYNDNGWSHQYRIPAVLDAPVIRGIVNDETATVISWDPVEGAEMYRVLIKRNGVWKKLADTADTVWRNTAAEPGVTETYTVCCISPDGKAYLSDYDPDGASLAFVSPPAIRWSFNTLHGPLFSWDACKGASAYRVMIRQGDEWAVIGDTSDTMFLHSEAVPRTTYTYAVMCLDAQGDPVSAFYPDGKTVYYSPDNARPIRTETEFAADIAQILGNDAVPADPHAPLSRCSAARVLVSALGYAPRTGVSLSDTDNAALLTAAYYGYFLPDDGDRIFAERLISDAEYSDLLAEVERYRQLRGKRILAFGDSIMFGRGNNGSGIAYITAEKYGMTAVSYAYNGASFGICNTRRHITDEIRDAYLAGHTADVILLNGGTNDISLVNAGKTQDRFDPAKPAESTFASGFEYAMMLIRHYWGDIPVIYIRAHNMSWYPDTLEQQMGEYGIQLAENWGAHTIDLYQTSALNTENDAMRERYTAYDEKYGYPDGVHPNALGYATYYLPSVSEKLSEIFS